VRRILLEEIPTPKHACSESSGRPLRVAIVACRYGADFVGGAETSLRTMARALKQHSHDVEVFTTCARSDNPWEDFYSEGTVEIDHVRIHRFRLDPVDHELFRAAASNIVDCNGTVTEEVEADYLRHSVRSKRLLDALRARHDEFDAIITGPYLFGLVHDVACEFPGQTLLAPCFHDEPFARLRAWQRVYPQVGGLLYHSPEEQILAEADLGLGSTGGRCIGSYVETGTSGRPERGHGHVGTPNRYLVYCGRYVAEKGLARLFEYAKRYCEVHPERYALALMGQGNYRIPRETWIQDLGFVGEATKRDVLAGAAALVHFSRNESLSLVALEAWAQGTPVLADANGEVLSGHIRRSGGGRIVHTYELFAAALDDLWERPEEWVAMGGKGREYVGSRYDSCENLAAGLETAIRDVRTPLRERLRSQGLTRAREFSRARWREEFGRFVEEVVHHPPRPFREAIAIQLRSAIRTAAVGDNVILVPARITNRGTHALLADGLSRVMLRSRRVKAGEQGEIVIDTPLPSLLMPGQSISMGIPVKVPSQPGTYQVVISAFGMTGQTQSARLGAESASMHLHVKDSRPGDAENYCSDLLATMEKAVAEAHALQRLPDNYIDVTQGRFAAWKAWIKRKLLGNFKRAYVDVLSRQQSGFNQRMLTAVQELTECCAMLSEQLTRNQQQLQSLESRLESKTDKKPRAKDKVER
jgi:glycosyltransferase involved in cell wall biosynthesis